jgi:hypothetical protein
MQKQQIFPKCLLRSQVHLPGPAGSTLYQLIAKGTCQSAGMVSTAAVYNYQLGIGEARA